MNENSKIMDDWMKQAKFFAGNKALFWSGRMSIVAGYVCTSTAFNLSRNIELLSAVKEAYDNQIITQTLESHKNAT